jgi:hypothetical protein
MPFGEDDHNQWWDAGEQAKGQQLAPQSLARLADVGVQGNRDCVLARVVQKYERVEEIAPRDEENY